MDSFEWNKVIGAVLASVLVIMVINITSHSLFHKEPLKKNVYVVEGVKEADTGTKTAKEQPKATPLPVLLADASVDKGARIFKKCEACHSDNPADGNKIGPNLHGVVGAKIAHRADFNYSDAVKNHGGTWTFDNLFHWLNSPKDFIPGTKMAFAGIKKPEERADVIAYLNQQSDNPLPLPKVEAPADQPAADAAGASADGAAKPATPEAGAAKPAADAAAKDAPTK